MNNVFDFELISRQYNIADRKERLEAISRVQQNVDAYMEELNLAIVSDDLNRVQSILETLYFEEIYEEMAAIWVDRIKQGKTTLENFKALYFKMPSWGFRPYHR